ncbi:MAG: pyridoxal phosphate-dependent aminotransferase [Pseudomonadales bacterium]|jgi:aspartate/methionine/tyrosine aminotransferase
MRERQRAERLAGVPPIGVDAMGARADAASDPDILRLENLDTDLRPPAAALDATRASIDDDDANSYLPFLGQSRLREAVVRHVERQSGQAYHPMEECIVTAGGLNGCMVTLNALIDPGDEVVVTDPTYIGMLNRIRIAGGVPVRIPFVWQAGAWRLDTDRLRSAIGPRTRALFLMNPSMPSGAVLDADEWAVVASLCAAHDLLLIYNAAMERILYDGRPCLHPAGLSGMRERTITVGSVSKEYRMIGWRVGWVAGPRALLREVGLVSISDVVVPVGIAQNAAAAALDSPAGDVASAVATWEARRDLIADELSGLPLRIAAGSWSMLLDAGELGLSGVEASTRLFEVGRVAATPMINWGERHGAQYVRLVFSNEPIERLQGIGGRVRSSLGV